MTGDLAGRRILLVEDEIIVVMMVEDMLAEHGCNAVAASNKARALDLLERERFDAAILDVNLGGAESYEIADILARQETPFLFATGYGARGLDPAYRHFPVLSKPFRDVELLAALCALIGNAEHEA